MAEVINMAYRMNPVVDGIMQDASPCPDCRAGNARLLPLLGAEQADIFALGCSACGYVGESARTLRGAVTRWNTDDQRHKITMQPCTH